MAQHVVNAVKRLDCEVRQATDNAVDLKVLLPAGLAVWAFLKAGACCLGVGGQLVEPKAVAERNFDRIRDLARQYVSIVKQTRSV